MSVVKRTNEEWRALLAVQRASISSDSCNVVMTT
jgi:hypothetical protein